MKIGRVANFGMRNSIMAFIFEIDQIFINYSYIMTCCHFGITRGHRNMKIVRVANFGMGNSIMSFIFEIEQIFINYSYMMTCCHIGTTW
jgi:hypothetical protein